MSKLLMSMPGTKTEIEMSKYVIHTCPPRKEYVNKYLIPSMVEQGIDRLDIAVRSDDYRLGNLAKCMEIFESMRSKGSAWHLQDDIVICKDFKERTEELTGDDIVCGYCWDKDDNVNNIGYVSPDGMWWSFPCIHIPNQYASECATWFYRVASYSPKYELWIASKKYDDYFFREFLRITYPDIKILNLTPNLVDHVDFLLGGTTVNGARTDKEVRSKYFEDLDLVKELEKKINERKV